MTTRTERKKTKLRFIGLYSVSLVLIFVLVSAFWRRLAPKNTPPAPSPVSEEAWFLQTDTALHAKMGAIDNLTDAYLKGQASGARPDSVAWLALQQSLRNTLDSLDRQAGYLTEGPKKTMMISVATSFRKALAYREAVVAGIAAMPKAATAPASGITPEEMNVLKQMLLEKDDVNTALQNQVRTKDETIAALQKQVQTAATTSGSATAGLQAAVVQRDKSISALQVQVASLQNQLRQKEAALQTVSGSRPADSQKDKTISTLQSQVTSLQNQLLQKEAELRTAPASKPVASGGGEWQQKYQSLKTSFDRVSASEKSLKNAYQTLAGDNRRLLSQLQSVRKG